MFFCMCVHKRYNTTSDRKALLTLTQEIAFAKYALFIHVQLCHSLIYWCCFYAVINFFFILCFTGVKALHNMETSCTTGVSCVETHMLSTHFQQYVHSASFQ